MTPGACEYELRTVQMGKSTKSCCGLRGGEMWTTCRDWGRCTLERYVPVIPDASEEEPEECEPEPACSETERTEAKQSESEQLRLF